MEATWRQLQSDWSIDGQHRYEQRINSQLQREGCAATMNWHEETKTRRHSFVSPYDMLWQRLWRHRNIVGELARAD